MQPDERGWTSVRREILTAFALSAATLAVCVCCFWLVNRPRTLIDAPNLLVTQQGHHVAVTDRVGGNLYLSAGIFIFSGISIPENRKPERAQKNGLIERLTLRR